MTIVRCPRCRDDVSVPAGATGRALVRCPLCLEEYLLAEALANLPPPLVIIGGEVLDEAIAAPGAEDEAAEERGYQLAGVFEGRRTAEHAPAAAVAMPRPMSRSALRPRQRSSGGVFLLVNYVVGGVLGLAMGLAVLWWGLARDPLELGPPVARYVPWIVPRAFRGSPAPAAASSRVAGSGDSRATDFPEDRSGLQQRRSDAAKPRARKPAASASDRSGDELQTLPALDAPATQRPATSSPIDLPVLDPAPLPANDKSPPATGPQPQAPPGDLTNAPAKDNPAERVESPAARPPMPDLTDLLAGWVPGPPAPTERAMPAVSARDFLRTVKATDDALQKYEQLPPDDSPGRRQALAEVWQAASEAGQMLSYFEASDATLREAVDRLDAVLRSLAGKRLKTITAIAAAEWPKLMSGDGVLVAGKVLDFSSAGRLYQLHLQPAMNQQPASTLPESIALLSGHDLHDLCSVGDEIVTIGRIVDEPRQNLPGYEGEQNRVVAVGFSVKVR